MIINGGDANKYTRNAKAAGHFVEVMEKIQQAILNEDYNIIYSIADMAADTADQLKEWIREKNYDVAWSGEGDELKIDWSNK